MILCDVNILIYALRDDAERHTEFRDWLQQRVEAHEGYGVSDLVLGGLLRIVTNPRTFRRPTAFATALAFAETLRSRPNAVTIAPGARHWGIFKELCERASARGNLVPDAYFAALAIESGCEWITADRGYARFPGLRWRHPLE